MKGFRMTSSLINGSGSYTVPTLELALLDAHHWFKFELNWTIAFPRDCTVEEANTILRGRLYGTGHHYTIEKV